MKTALELTTELCAILKSNYYLKGSTLDYDFVIEPGNKYLKIVCVNNQKSVMRLLIKRMATCIRQNLGNHLPRVSVLTCLPILKNYGK
jgi:hypothetical protein